MPPKYMLLAPSASKAVTSVMTAVSAWNARLPAMTFMWRQASTRTTSGFSASNAAFTVSTAESTVRPSGTVMLSTLSAPHS